jgi:hypothetical protein
MATNRRDVLQLGSLSAFIGAVGYNAWGQTQAFESLKIITGFTPGGTSDAICPRVAEKMPLPVTPKPLSNKTKLASLLGARPIQNSLTLAPPLQARRHHFIGALLGKYANIDQPRDFPLHPIRHL